MNLSLIELKRDDGARAVFERINEEAFPPSERMSMAEIFDFAAATDTQVLGIYDDERPVGFLVLMKNEVCGYIYFLAIDSGMRSRGYGSAALGKLSEMYPHLQIVLDFEEVTPNAENAPQRMRRREFYLRSGFHETGHYTMLRGERFEVVCSGGALQEEAFRKLIRIIHRHCPDFPDLLL